MQHGIQQQIAVCETGEKIVDRTTASSFFQYLLEKNSKNFLEKLFGQSNVSIISKCRSSLSNKFYDRNQTLQTEAISDFVSID